MFPVYIYNNNRLFFFLNDVYSVFMVYTMYKKDEKTMTDTNLRHDNKETPTDTQRMIADYEIVLS